MVATTIILAAIVAAFVFGMVSDVKSTKIVAVTAGHQGDNLILTNMGGQDVAKVTQFEAMYNNTAVSSPGIGVGKSATTDVGTGNAHLIVVATFNDGSQQVVLDTYT